MNTRLENLVVSGLVAAAISVSISSADTAPGLTFKGAKAPGQPAINTLPPNGPSLADRVAALSRRVDTLQNSDAATRQNLRQIVAAINDTAAQAQDAEDQAACITAGYQAAWSPTGTLVANNDAPSLNNFIIATLDPDCAA